MGIAIISSFLYFYAVKILMNIATIEMITVSIISL